MLVAIAIIAVAASSVVSAQSLNALAQAKGRYFGAAGDINEITDSTNVALLRQHSGLITPTNAMKWESTEPSQNTFTFSGGDQTVAFAKANNQLCRGHTLVWHSQLPNWVTSRSWTNATLTAVMTNHVTKLVDHWKGDLVHWDVVNEIFNEDGSLRSSPFSNTIGEAFVSIAFRTARAADPNVKLFINDYNLDYVSAKSNAMINLVRRLRSQGVPIDGIGSQAHLIVGSVSSTFQSVLQSFSALGVLTALTELDIRTNTPASSAKLAQQQQDYKTVTAACLATVNCVGIETWGISDKYSWIPGVFSGEGDALPFDSQFRAKPALQGIIDGFSASAAFPTSTTTVAPSTTAVTSATTTTTTTTTTSSPDATSTVTCSAQVVYITTTVTVTSVVGPSSTTTTTTTSPTPTGTGTCSVKYGQCGGNGWNGPKCCVPGSTCTRLNDFYSQCL
ncbi:putative endo-1,4-beta-xylanase [Cladochytrium replicatum]|nr:putative endo-1,4-beta-xylanase [Cladochytrium replicatum]